MIKIIHILYIQLEVVYVLTGVDILCYTGFIVFICNFDIYAFHGPDMIEIVLIQRTSQLIHPYFNSNISYKEHAVVKIACLIISLFIQKKGYIGLYVKNFVPC